ncbi:MAG TPA: ROK family protein [Candidatus Angelobacter sp.]|nr:ROK family protein [Candidatus Angelobacter sp.]
MKVLVIDIGGTNVKMLATGHAQPLKFPSGSGLTPSQMVARAKRLSAKWEYDVLSIGVPGPVLFGELVAEPLNLGPGWVGFDFSAAFGVPVKLVNDAAMQAVGSYRGGRMLFFGLGTGLGTALVINGVAESREIAHFPYKKGTYEEYVGARALRRLGKKKWRRHVNEIISNFLTKVHVDDVVVGGGNAKKLKKLPKGCRAGDNANAFVGGFRLWEEPRAKSGSPKVVKLVPRKGQSSSETRSSATRTKLRA